MSGNAKQRRKRRRAAARAGAVAPVVALPPVLETDRSPLLTADELVALASTPSKWWLAGGIAAVVVLIGVFVAWVVTLPARP